jgi:hypothetical protein
MPLKSPKRCIQKGPRCHFSKCRWSLVSWIRAGYSSHHNLLLPCRLMLSENKLLIWRRIVLLIWRKIAYLMTLGTVGLRIRTRWCRYTVKVSHQIEAFLRWCTSQLHLYHLRLTKGFQITIRNWIQSTSSHPSYNHNSSLFSSHYSTEGLKTKKN